MNFPLNPLIITTPPRILWLAMFTKVATHGRFKKRQYGGVRPVMRVPPNPPKLDYVNWDILKAMGIPHDFGNPDVAIVLSRHVSPALWQQQGQQSEDYAGEIKDGVPVSGQWKSQNPRKFVFSHKDGTHKSSKLYKVHGLGVPHFLEPPKCYLVEPRNEFVFDSNPTVDFPSQDFNGCDYSHWRPAVKLCSCLVLNPGRWYSNLGNLNSQTEHPATRPWSLLSLVLRRCETGCSSAMFDGAGMYVYTGINMVIILKIHMWLVGLQCIPTEKL